MEVVWCRSWVGVCTARLADIYSTLAGETKLFTARCSRVSINMSLRHVWFKGTAPGAATIRPFDNVHSALLGLIEEVAVECGLPRMK